MNLSRIFTPLSVPLAALLLVANAPAPSSAKNLGEKLDITATRTALHPHQPDAYSLGPLDWMGTLVLAARDNRFGGLSALARWPKRAQAAAPSAAPPGPLLALSDRGYWFHFALQRDADGRLSGVDQMRVGRLAGPSGHPLPATVQAADAEALAVLADGRVAIAFERDHRLLLYTDPRGGTATPLVLPPAIQQASPNGGIEALTALRDGRILAITEALAGSDAATRRGWLQDENEKGGWIAFHYQSAARAFAPTALATLPDGQIIVLERAYSPLLGVRIRIARFNPLAIRADATMIPDVLAVLGPPLRLDNFEAITAWTEQGPDGPRVMLLLASDDNYNRLLQRSLLMLFALR